jgi:hypothetical protein
MLFHEQTSKSYSSAALPTSGLLDKLTESTAVASTATTVYISEVDNSKEAKVGEHSLLTTLWPSFLVVTVVTIVTMVTVTASCQDGTDLGIY